MFNPEIFHLLALVKKLWVGMDIVPYHKGKREKGDRLASCTWSLAATSSI
jgi:hypothetical protein